MNTWLQDDPPLPPEPVRPRPRGVEEIGEHAYEWGEEYCLYCGTHIEDATSKACGTR